MKILLLCNKSPWPLFEGGPIAMHSMISGLLQAGHQVKVLAANTNKYTVDPATIPESFSRSTGIEFAYIDLSIRPLDALYNYLTRQSYHVIRFRARSFREKLVSILQKENFDIIQVEMLYMTIYLNTIRKYSRAPVILRAHNIEHLIWKRIAENSLNTLKKHYLKQLYRSLRSYELSMLSQVDGIVAITETDSGFFRKHAGTVPVISIPFGINPVSLPSPSPTPSETDLFHIGSMNWIPNEEGISWFLVQVWPEVSKRHQKLKLFLAGRAMPDWLLSLKLPGIEVLGEVPDAGLFMQQHQIMIVPLFSGSGIRIKIIEAMTAGKVVISTSIGAEGIGYEQGKNLIIADSADDFVKAIDRLIADENYRLALGQNARSLMLSEHNNAELMKRLTGFYHQLLKSPGE